MNLFFTVPKTSLLLFLIVFLFGFKNETPTKVKTGLNNSIMEEKPLAKKMLFNEEASYNNKVNLDSIAIAYTNTKTDANQLRKRLNEELLLGIISFDSIKIEFTNQLVDKIIPHWYGTPWSFGGHTAIPNQGKIACGYFISTTLRDMGIKINRYSLAQKSPIDEAKMISCGSVINSVVEDTPEKAIEEIDRLTKEGLHFIGFDEGHVGYLLKRDGELFLIHSNYLSPISVCIEPLATSRVFKSFSKFHLVDISHNDALLKRWLNNGTVL